MPDPITFAPADWYWRAADGRIYASARHAVVATDDATFLAWQARGLGPTPWPKDEAGAESDAALWAVLAPYGLGPKRRFTFIEFMDLFTAAEQAAVVGSDDVEVRLFLLMAAGATYLDLDDTRTAQGLDALAGKGMLTTERVAAVLAGQAPA